MTEPRYDSPIDRYESQLLEENRALQAKLDIAERKNNDYFAIYSKWENIDKAEAIARANELQAKLARLERVSCEWQDEHAKAQRENSELKQMVEELEGMEVEAGCERHQKLVTELQAKLAALEAERDELGNRLGTLVRQAPPECSVDPALLDKIDCLEREAEIGRAKIIEQQQRITALEAEVKRLKGFKRHVDEALNSGDGSYKP